MTDTPDREPTLREILDRINRFNERFSDYQKATQWLVQLAFALIASSTVTVIITAIFKSK